MIRLYMPDLSLLFMADYKLLIAVPLYNENFNQCY